MPHHAIEDLLPQRRVATGVLPEGRCHIEQMQNADSDVRVATGVLPEGRCDATTLEIVACYEGRKWARCYVSLGCRSGDGTVDYMVRRDLLSAYADLDVVRRAMGHILRRLGMQHLAGHLDAALAADLPGFSADSKTLLPGAGGLRASGAGEIAVLCPTAT